MKSIRLMVVDDSAFMRKIVSDAASNIPQVTLVGTARNGEDALEQIDRLKPDLITMDIEMPKMDGITALKQVKEKYPHIEVVMLSSHSKEGSQVTMEALALGALDFIEKSKDRGDLSSLRQELEEKVEVYITAKGIEKSHKVIKPRTPREARVESTSSRKPVKAIVMGASTGGPKVLFQIVKNLPKTTNVPVFIVQHMPKGFTASFADRLNGESPLNVVEAEHGMRITPGTVYVAPGDYHMLVEGNEIKLTQTEKVHGVRPCADLTFESVTEKYQGDLLGILLTGMGKDGALGFKAMKEAGAYTLAQDQESSVVYGMPGNAVKMGVVDEILTPDEIIKEIEKVVARPWK